MGNRLHTVKQILEADMYEIVDEVKIIITKSQSKQSVMKNQVSMQKIDRYSTIAADDTGKIKLIWWEQLIDSVHSGLSYQFNNLAICIFDMRNLSTLMSWLLLNQQVTLHMESPEIKDKLLVGQHIAIYINRSTSCIAQGTKLCDQDSKVSRQVGNQNSLGFEYLNLMSFATK